LLYALGGALLLRRLAVTFMKKILLTGLCGLALLFGRNTARAQTQVDPELTTQFKTFMTNVQGHLALKERDEHSYAEPLKLADAMIAQHKAQKTDQVAHVLFMEAMLYTEVITNADRYDKATALIEQLKKDFPDTKDGQNAEKILASFKDAQDAEKIQSQLVAGAVFPDFSETDFDGKPVSVAAHKGHVVLIDFWATWCGPCRKEFPNVKKTYEDLHAKGFDIIGVSLDKEKSSLADFIKENGVTWPQYFDGLYWQNKLAVRYGIRSIPATILVDGEGKIIGKDLRGEDLRDAVTKALAKSGA
jgi:thiol-disulfide isomerase/thioredoxin